MKCEISLYHIILFQSRCLYSQRVKWNSSLTLLSCHVAQLVRLRRLGWAGHVIRHDKLIVHEVMFSQVDLKRRGRHRTLVAVLADDLSHICSFACRDASLLDNKEEFKHNYSLFIGQAGDLGCFKCPSCAKPYISATWFQKHLSKCPQPTGATTGLNWTELISCYCCMPCNFHQLYLLVGQEK